MTDRITIDIGILQGIFSDLHKLQQRLGGISGGVAAIDNAAAKSFGSMQGSVNGVTNALHGVDGAANRAFKDLQGSAGATQSAVQSLDNGFDASMRNIVADIMGPVAKTQELKDKLRTLNSQFNTAKSTGEVRRLKQEIAATQAELNRVNPSRMEQRVDGAFKRMRSTVMGLAIPIAGAFAVGGVVGFTKSVVQAVAGAESFNASMKVMLGGQEQATKMSKELREFAIATPFDVPGLRNYTTQLSAYGTSADGIIPTLDALGNIAAGVGTDKLPQLVTAFGQVQAAGKLTGGELKQFTEAGVPLLEELAKITGKKTSEMAGNIAKLDIPFETVRQALFGMTAEGGKFHDLMAEQAKTVGGQLAAAGEAWGAFLEDMGTALLPQIISAVQMFGSALDGLRSAFQWVMENGGTIKEVLTVIAGVTAWYGGILLWNNRALIQNEILKLRVAAADRIGAIWRALTTSSTTAATAATWSWNAALLANPAGILVLAIMGPVAALVAAWNRFEGFRAFLYGFWESVKVVFAGIWEVVKTTFSGVVEIARGVWDILAGRFTADFDRVGEGFKQFGKGIADSLTSPFRAVGEVVKQSEALGAKMAFAYAKGDVRGRAAFRAEKEKEAGQGLDATNFSAPGQDMGASGLTSTAPKASGSGKGDGVTVGGDGKGGGRTITMDIVINNHFTLAKDANMGIRQAADAFAAQLTNKLNDAQYAMG